MMVVHNWHGSRKPRGRTACPRLAIRQAQAHRGRSPLASVPREPSLETLEKDRDDGCGIEGEYLRQSEVADDGVAERLMNFRSDSGVEHDWNAAKQRRQIANLLMLRGNTGRQGAGVSPLEGHSNVRGDGTVGITEIPNNELLDGIVRAFGLEPPRNEGHHAIEAIEAIRDGRSKALICLGGKLAAAMFGPEVTFKAMRNLDLAAKLNRSICCSRSNPTFFLVWDAPKFMFKRPVASRLPWKTQSHGPRFSRRTQACVRRSQIRAGNYRGDGAGHVAEHAGGMATVNLQLWKDSRLRRGGLSGIGGLHARIKTPRGLRLYVAASERERLTPTKKANLSFTSASMRIRVSRIVTPLRSRRSEVTIKKDDLRPESLLS